MIGKILGDVRYIAISAILGVAALLKVINLFGIFEYLSFVSILNALIPLAAIGALIVHLLIFHGEGSKLMIYAYCGLTFLSFIFSFLVNKNMMGYQPSILTNLITMVAPLIVVFVISTGVISMKSPIFFLIVGSAAFITAFPGLIDIIRVFRYFPAGMMLKNLFNIILSAGVTASACMLATDWD